VNPWLFVLPIAAAAFYATSATLLKRVSLGGVDAWRVTVHTMLCTSLVLQGFWLLPGPTPTAQLFLQAAGPGVLFLLAQIFTILAIQHGDVSIATPLMGVKVILVAILAALVLGEIARWNVWLGAAITTAAIALLRGGNGNADVGATANRWDQPRRRHARHQALRTVIFALCASFFFALTDVLVQDAGRVWGATRLGPAMMLVCGVASLPLIFLFEKTKPSLLEGSHRMLLGACLTYALQVVCMLTALAALGHATTVNIIYSVRGIFGVLAAWALGPLLGLHERHHGRAVMIRRLTAAVLIFAAILIAVL
jgi:drug/metabolite transporter (DMT)-like permease